MNLKTNSYQTYSFTKSRKKHLLSQEMRLIAFFFSMTIFVLLSTYFALLYTEKSFKETAAKYQQRKSDLNISITKMSSDIEFIYTQDAQSENIFTANTIIKDSIHNLFDLVPNKIVLSNAKIDKYSLILQGRTPTKEMYNFRLQAPLRSLFHESYSSFYPAKNGWYYFVSKNYLNRDKDLEE